MGRLTTLVTGLTGLLMATACATPAAAPPARSTAPPAVAPTTSNTTSAATSGTTSASSSVAATAAPRPVSLKVGVLGTTSDAPMFVAYEKGYFRELGLDVEFVNFATAAEMIAPLSTEQLQVGAGGINAGLFNAIGRGVPLKFVADKNHTPPDYQGSGWLLRKELADSGAVRDAADLRGRVVALGSRASVADSELSVILRRAGLTLQDVEIKELRYADQPVAFGQGAVDLAYSFEPFSSATISRGFAVMWLLSGQVIPNHVQSIVMYSPGFSRDKDAGVRWMIAYIKASREVRDAYRTLPADEEIGRILTQYTNVKDLDVVRRSPPGAVNPNGYIFVDTVQQDLDFFAEAGFLNQPIDLAQVIDHSFVEGALEVLGRR